jgi:hypothetical protein
MARLDDVGYVDTRVAHVLELREAARSNGDGRVPAGSETITS